MQRVIAAAYRCSLNRRSNRRAGQSEGRQGSRRYGLSVSDANPAAADPRGRRKRDAFGIKVPHAEPRAVMAELKPEAGASFDSVANLNAKD